MALIENLVVALGLQSKGFDTGIDKSKAKLSTFQQSVSQMGSNLQIYARRLIAVTAAYVGVSRGIDKFNQSRQTLDSLAKTSAKLGVGAEHLAAMRYAAGQAGMSVQSFDTALQRMIKRISYAAQGQGEGLKAFEQLNLDAKELIKLTPEKQLRAIANAFQKVNSQTDRVGLAARIFDSEGVAIVNTLAGGSKYLDDMLAKLKRLGGLFSTVELAAVEKMNDSFEDLKIAIDSAWERLTVNLAPGLIVAAEELTKFVLAIRSIGIESYDVAEVFTRSFGIMTEMLIVLTANTRYLINHMKILGTLIGGFAAGDFAITMKQVDEMFKKYGEINEQIEKALKGGYTDAFLERLKQIRNELLGIQSDQQGQGGEEPAGGVEKKLTPAALRQGTREAAIAAMNAGANDRNVELFKVAVKKVDEVSAHAAVIKTMLADVLAAVGSPAGIIP